MNYTLPSDVNELNNISLVNKIFVKVSFAGKKLKNIDFSGCTFEDVDFTDTELDSCNFTDINLISWTILGTTCSRTGREQVSRSPRPPVLMTGCGSSIRVWTR